MELFFFVEFRERVESSYTGLFGQGSSEGYTTEGGFEQKWGFYSSFYQATQGDITKFEHISEMGVHKVLMYLEFVNEKTRLEQIRIKQSYGNR